LLSTNYGALVPEDYYGWNDWVYGQWVGELKV
jgi:hypothetical protein